MIWSDFKMGTGNILHCCYLCLFVRSQRVIVPLIDAVSAVSLLLVPPSHTGSSQSFMPHISACTLIACVCFILPRVCNAPYEPSICIQEHLQKKRKEARLYTCVCLCVHYKHSGPVIGTRTRQLSVSLKLQNRDRIRKFHHSAISARPCSALRLLLCLTDGGLLPGRQAGS